MPSLSVILITKNEAVNIRECLESVAFADQIIVIDGASVDGTAEIARECGAQVVVATDWPGFGPQKNRALDLASCDWVLSLDADERVDAALAAEIRQMLEQPTADAFDLPRRSWFCGQWVQHSGWWPDYVTRLFRRGTCRFSDDLVHERLLLVEQSATLGRLAAPLRHYSYRTLSQVLQKVDNYSSAGAEMNFQRKKKGGISKALLHGLWSFIRTYLLKLGFLDGKAGFLIAMMNAQASFYKYAKLMYLQNNSSFLD